MKPNNPIAIVAMSGIFPGANSIEKFWQNILNKENSTTSIPPDRWIAPAHEMIGSRNQQDRACSSIAGLIHDFTFDPTGFNVDADLLTALDPLYQIVLTAGREAFNGCRMTSPDRKRCGLILAAIALPTDGASYITREIFGTQFENDVKTLLGKTRESKFIKPFDHAQALSGKVTALPASLLAQSLGLGGGSYTLDAACASSLYAVKLACDELNAGRADVMMAGGVSRPDCLFTQVGFTQLQALSPSGCCSPFDDRADGLVVGEGCGILVLKRLEDALTANDNILALIQGIGLSNDIGGNLIAPDSEGQLRSMRRAYERSGRHPHDIDLIECHGAGTPVGDAIEVNSLCQLWGTQGWQKGQCALGSVKSNIGHLLTAAAAAGLIKTVLGLVHQTLPPSLNFSHPPANSLLPDSPFRVQTQAADWPFRHRGEPRRAAINAFGFGGINAHLLVEEFSSNDHAPYAVPGTMPSSDAITVSSTENEPASAIAIVGMAASFGPLSSLREYQECILNGRSIFSERPAERMRGIHIDGKMGGRKPDDVFRLGGFLQEVATYIGEFQIPPNEIPDLLPQHLVMLKVAANALADAGLLPAKERTLESKSDMGVTIGMAFDFEATDFHLRWFQHNVLRELLDDETVDPTDKEIQTWITALKDSCAQPLTASRTIGALGGIIASRIAKQFKLGGPSFVVSADEASGLKALEIGVRSLQQKETRSFLVGAVDLPGDLRRMLTSPITPNPGAPFQTAAFDATAEGSLPGEGACAVVLKTLDQAIADGNRIYAVIRGCGNSGGGGLQANGTKVDAALQNVYLQSLRAAFIDADLPAETVSYIEAHGSATPAQDTAEIMALGEYFGEALTSVALGTVKPNIGNTGAAAGLASVVKTGLCLYQEMIPPLTNFKRPIGALSRSSHFHIPHFPQYWVRDRIEGPRRACVAAITADGNCSHVILEEFSTERYPGSNPALLEKIVHERKKPLGNLPSGLFVFDGDSDEDIAHALDQFDQFISQSKIRPLPIESVAREWFRVRPPHPSHALALSMIAANHDDLSKWLPIAKQSVSNQERRQITGPSGIMYTPEAPLSTTGRLAFVFPGSGNHYVGMGRGIGVVWPEILRHMDMETERLKSQMLPDCYVPWRIDWDDGWELSAHQKLISDPIFMIFGQVVHGGVMANLIKKMSIRPSAVIGYSLGETAGYFAMGAWPERGHMLKRMQDSDLFTTKLAGPCLTARKVWNVPDEETVDWCVAVVDRPADQVREVLQQVDQAHLLIVNTPKECVIGGRKPAIEVVVKKLHCNTFFLNGVVTVHCDAMAPEKDAYRALHLFPTTQPSGIDFYSCAIGRTHELTTDRTADSILQQAMQGFDFPLTINQAYADGIRVFLEMGPYFSCSRMINQILAERDHLALSVCNRSEEDYLTVLKCLGTLITERIPVDLDFLYGPRSFALNYGDKGLLVPTAHAERKIVLPIGGKKIVPPHPPKTLTLPIGGTSRNNSRRPSAPSSITATIPELEGDTPKGEENAVFNYFKALVEPIAQNTATVSEAHKSFLVFSEDLSQAYADTFHFQTQLLEKAIQSGNLAVTPMIDSSPKTEIPTKKDANQPPPAYDRNMCLEFAVGSVAKVLGPEFADVDTYDVRVRLPDEPLMLVDRIISVEGEKNSLSSGRLVTEHDVLPGAWYLDGGRAPTCISIEAGQADLFLSAYMGIDLAVKGTRSYRLLDAVATFHRGLPRPGDVIRYDIQIEKFIHQGETYLFFFNFNGYIGDSHLITMKNGCAGFFTPEEVQHSGGIILTEEERKPKPGKRDPHFKQLVPLEKSSYDDDKVQALREGNLEQAFGHAFKGVALSESIRLPDGKMKLIDRIVSLDPEGGRYGLGRIVGEADIHPDDWFLTCHFVDDRVMPGTLMYQCCEHTLRVFTQRLGWVSDKQGICYEPMIGIESRLKCRGPVTPTTKIVTYEVEISALGYNPEPYVIADAHIHADGREIVMFHDMCMKLSNITQLEIEFYWEKIKQSQTCSLTSPTSTPGKRPPFKGNEVVFDKNSLLSFALGKPSEGFGAKYQPFDADRFIARLPNPPYLLMDRVVSVEPEPWVLKPAGWIKAELDLTENDWFFTANRNACLPFAILLEIALQPCGWLAAYMGSALKSDKPLKFRNLGGTATLHYDIPPVRTTLTMRSRLTRVSQAGEMIIETFDFQVLEEGRLVYEGNTNFGFFTLESLAQQVGLRGAEEIVYRPTDAELAFNEPPDIPDLPPYTPDEAQSLMFDFNAKPCGQIPGKALRMIDYIDIYIKNGGPNQLGFIRGIKIVDPEEWFFKAHFFKDPVCPGSLGIESFLQLIKIIAMDHFREYTETHRFVHLDNETHTWAYRGQIAPQNQRIEIEAVVTRIDHTPHPLVVAEGYLKVDGLYIYKMDNFGIKLMPYE